MEEITLSGIITGAALPLFGYLAVHWLALAREKSSRCAKASNDFREAIIKATTKIPNNDAHWDSQTLSLVQTTKDEIKVAIDIFQYFLSDKERLMINNEFSNFDDLILNKIPKALSPAEIMYGGRQAAVTEVIQTYHEHIKKFKDYAIKI